MGRMKAKPDVTPSAGEMREMIARLSAGERASLKDPNFVTVQVVGAVFRSEGTACALRCDRMAVPR